MILKVRRLTVFISAHVLIFLFVFVGLMSADVFAAAREKLGMSEDDIPNLMDGEDIGEPLPAVVMARIEALRENQIRRQTIEEKYREERKALDQKYREPERVCFPQLSVLRVLRATCAADCEATELNLNATHRRLRPRHQHPCSGATAGACVHVQSNRRGPIPSRMCS